MSEWRKNYMRTLEMRTVNAKRVLKLNIKSDVEKASAEAEKVLEQISKLEGMTRNTLRGLNPVPMNITIKGPEESRNQSSLGLNSNLISQTASPNPDQSMQTTFIRKRLTQPPPDETPAAYETPRAAQVK